MEQLARNVLSTETLPPGLLTVEVDSASDLPSPLIGFTDPFVIVEFGSNKAQTEVIKNTTNPVWRAKFFFKTDDVMNFPEKYNPADAQKFNSYFRQSVEEVIQDADKTIKLNKVKLQDESYSESKKIKGTISVTLSWTGGDDNQLNSKKSEQTTMRKFNYDGVFKLTILSGTNLSRLEKLENLFVEIYHDREKNLVPKHTEKKVQKNAQWNQAFFYSIDKENKIFNIDIINVHKQRYLGSTATIDLANYPLVRHKPKTYEIILKHPSLATYSAQLLTEMTFYHNIFTKDPTGFLRIEANKLPSAGDRKKLYFKYNIEGGLNSSGETGKFSKPGTVKEFWTSSQLDRIVMICMENTLNLNKEIARGIFYLSELPWSKQDKNEQIYTCRKKLDLIGKEKSYQAVVTLTYRSLVALTTKFSKTSDDQGGAHESPQKKPDREEEEEEAIKPTTLMPDDKKPALKFGEFSKPETEEDAEEVKEEQEETANAKIVWINSIELSSFLLKIKLFDHPNYFFAIRNTINDQLTFTSFSKSSIPEWTSERIPIYVPETTGALSFALHELNFVSVNNESRKPIPVEIITGLLNLSDINVNSGNNTQQTIETTVSKEFSDFIKKNFIRNDDAFVKDPITALEKARIKVNLEVNSSYFINKPEGILSIQSIKGERLGVLDKDGKQIPTKLKLQVLLGDQVFNVDEDVDEQNPVWSPELDLITKTPFDRVQIRIIEDKAETSIILGDIFIPLCNLAINKRDEKVLYSSPVSGLSGVIKVEMRYSALSGNSLAMLKPIPASEIMVKDPLEIYNAKWKKEETSSKQVELPDWSQCYGNKTYNLEIILEEISLSLDLKEGYTVEPTIKLGTQYFVGLKHYNQNKIRYSEKFSMNANVNKENERNVSFSIKVCDITNPLKVLRLYTYIFHWPKMLSSSQDYITVNARLVSSTVHNKDKDIYHNLIFRYRLVEPIIANAEKKFGLIGIKPLQLRTAGLNMTEAQIWQPLVGYVLSVAFNGVKVYFKAKTGKPQTFKSMMVYHYDDPDFNNRVYSTSEFFIDKTETALDTVLELILEGGNPSYFPLKSKNDKFIKVKLYQISSEGIGIAFQRMKTNQHAKMVGKGMFDIAALRNHETGLYAVKLHKDLVLTKDERFANPVSLHLLNTYLTLEIQPYFLDMFELVNPNLALSLRSLKPIHTKPDDAIFLLREIKMNYAANNDESILGHIFTLIDKQDIPKLENKMVGPLKNITTRRLKNFEFLNLSFNPSNPLFDRDEFFYHPRNGDTIYINRTTITLDQENDPNDVKNLEPTMSVELHNNVQNLSLGHFPFQRGTQLTLYSELKNETDSVGNCKFRLEYITNFFTELPQGKFTIRKLELKLENQASFDGLEHLELYVKSRKTSEQGEKITIPLTAFESRDGSFVLPKPLEFETIEKSSSFHIEFRNKRLPIPVIGTKMHLYDIDFPNPHNIQKTKVEDSDIEIHRVIILPYPTKLSPKAFILINIYCSYKDRTSLTDHNFKSFYTLLRFRNIINARFDQMRRIVYYNPTSKPLIFGGRFKRYYYSIGRADLSFLPICHKKQLDILEGKKFKLRAANRDDITSLNLRFPSRTKFNLPGIVSMKEPIKIIVSYTSIYKIREKSKDRNVKDTTVSISYTLKIDMVNYREVVEGGLTHLELELLSPIDLHLPDYDILNNTIDITFQYTAKSQGLTEQKATLNYSDYLQQLKNSKSVEPTPQRLFIFMKPSSQKIMIELNQIASDFINDPHGKIDISIHRLVLLDEVIETEEGIAYKNKNLTLKKKDEALKGVSQRNKFHFEVNMKLQKQRQTSGIFNHQGVPIEATPSDFTFFTSDVGNYLDITLNIHTEQTNIKDKLSKGELLNNEVLKKIGNEEGKSSSSNSIIVAKSRVSLGSLPLIPHKTYPIYIPLYAQNYPNNDLIKVFLDTLNRDNIIILGSFTYTPEKWYNVAFKVNKLENIKFSKLDEFSDSTLDATIDEQEISLPRLGVTIEANRRLNTGETKELYVYESMLYETNPKEGSILTFNDNEAFNVIYDDADAPNEELYANISLRYCHGNKSDVIATKVISLKNQFLNSKATGKSQIISANLQRLENVECPLDRTIKEFPLTFELCSSMNYGESLAPKKKKEEKKSQLVSFDFRENDITEMILAMVNSTINLVITEAMKEINEYLMFEHLESASFPYSKPLFYAFRAILRLYSEKREMASLSIKNIFALLTFDQKLLRKVEFESFLEDLVECCLVYMKKYELSSQDNELKEIMQNFNYKFYNAEKTKEVYQEMEPFKVEDLKDADFETIFIHAKNNSIYPAGEDENKEEQIENPADFAKTLVYIMKIIDVALSEIPEFNHQIITKVLPVLTKFTKHFINSDENLLLSYLKLTRKCLIDFEDSYAESICLKTLRQVLDCVMEIDLTKSKKNLELIFRIHSFVNKKIAQLLDNKEKVKDLYNQQLLYMQKNALDDNIAYLYELFSLIIRIFQDPNVDPQLLQEFFNSADIYFKIISYLSILAKLIEETNIEREMNQILQVLEEIISRYQIKNFNKDRVIGNLQVLLNKKGLSEKTKIKILHIINFYRNIKHGDDEHKKARLLQALKGQTKETKHKDITTKYLISKLDWMK